MKTEKQQTAVEWYAEQSMRLELERAKGNISINEMFNQLSNVLEKAKEMEKEQIENAYEIGFADAWDDARYDDEPKYATAEQYYNETFKSE
jgi:hypothetical protein